MGLTAKAFRAENPSTGLHPSAPAYGVAYYQIEHTNSHGCVTAYAITMRTRPAQSASEFLSLFGGTYLPIDARPVASKSTCLAWRSSTLQKHFGQAYAVGVLAYPQHGQASGRASISLSTTDSC